MDFITALSPTQESKCNCGCGHAMLGSSLICSDAFSLIIMISVFKHIRFCYVWKLLNFGDFSARHNIWNAVTAHFGTILFPSSTSLGLYL